MQQLVRLPEEPASALWIGAVLVTCLKLIALSQASGVVRLISGSFATQEDAAQLRATFGHAESSSRMPVLLKRIQRVHRNELENVAPFFAISYCYALTSPFATEGVPLRPIPVHA